LQKCKINIFRAIYGFKYSFPPGIGNTEPDSQLFTDLYTSVPCVLFRFLLTYTGIRELGFRSYQGQLVGEHD